MSLSTKFLSFFLSFAFPIFLFSETATIKVYTSLVDYEAFFSDDDVQMLSYNLIDAGLTSNKVQVSGSMTIDGVYTSFTGELDSPFESQDNNQNGIYDFFEVDQPYKTSISGSASYTLQGYGSFTANLFASINRVHNQHAFTMYETVTIQSSSITGINAGQTEYLSETLTAIHARFYSFPSLSGVKRGPGWMELSHLALGLQPERQRLAFLPADEFGMDGLAQQKPRMVPI